MKAKRNRLRISGAGSEDRSMKKRTGGWLTAALLAAALAMCVYGAAAGQAEDVLAKAVRICMECIGLG